ncbi:MAG TPA: hypothetical protein PK581_08455 [Caldisericia bacterium]|nr:hypothetical protein [Caldisericia bacterium]
MDQNQFQSYSSKIVKIEESFSRAEEIQKLSGVYGAPVFIPVINELRYCGKHLLTALKSQIL